MITVPRIEAMKHRIFRKHLNARHVPVGDFANLTKLSEGREAKKDRKAFEAYHAYLHRTGDYEHEHV